MSFSQINVDRLMVVVHSLASRNRWHRDDKVKEEALDLIQDQALEIVRLEAERDDLLGVVSMRDPVEQVDVVTDDEAVAFITKATNRWIRNGQRQLKRAAAHPAATNEEQSKCK